MSTTEERDARNQGKGRTGYSWLRKQRKHWQELAGRKSRYKGGDHIPEWLQAFVFLLAGPFQPMPETPAQVSSRVRTIAPVVPSYGILQMRRGRRPAPSELADFPFALTFWLAALPALMSCNSLNLLPHRGRTPPPAWIADKGLARTDPLDPPKLWYSLSPLRCGLGILR